MRRLAWGAAYLAAAVVAFASAVLAAPGAARAPLLEVAGLAGALAAVYAIAGVFGRGRSIVAEALGLAGLSLTAPMMAAAAGRPLDRSLFCASVLAVGYFFSSVAFVRSYERLQEDRLAGMRACVLAHVAIALVLVLASAVFPTPRWWWLAYVPVAARTMWGLARPPGNLRQLGLRELWVAIAFTAIACVTLS